MSKLNPGKPCYYSRRSMLKFGFSVGMYPAIVVVSNKAAAATDSRITPPQTKGPFYPIHQQADKDTDLTQIEGHEQVAAGEPINVSGRVLAPNGTPLENAMVEIWQADANGRYRHVRDPNPAPLDPDFQGWGIAHSDAKGNYRFATIVPGAYPAGPGWMRPPHIHFKVEMKNFEPLITQMYFPGNRLNDSDLILQHLPAQDQKMVISKRISNSERGTEYQFDIILKPSI